MFKTILLDESNITYAPAKNRNKDDFVQIGEVDGIPVNASINSYITAQLYKTIVRDLAILDAKKAIDKWNREDQSDDRASIIEGLETDDYDSLWIVKDNQGFTFMFPEEY